MRSPAVDHQIKCALRDFQAALFLWRIYEQDCIIPPWVIEAVDSTAAALERLGISPVKWEGG